MANNSKVHIKHESPEQGITINVFGDTPEEAMQLLVDTMAHIQGNTAKDPVNAAYAQDPQANPARPQPQPGGNGGSGTINRPVCKDCGSSDDLELITFTDQQSGQPKRRFKCQTCKIWVGKAF